MSQHFSFEVSEGEKGRLDKIICEHVEGFSRSRLQSLVKEGQVVVNGVVCEQPSQKIKAGDKITLIVPASLEAHLQGENIPLNILYEDDDVIVINKQAGLVVHPGAGNFQGTLVNALIYHCGDSLSGIGGVIRPGIVHRLDKDTSGLMVVAKNDSAHQSLSAQLQDRSLKRIYKALVFKVPIPSVGTIDRPIGRHVHHRLKMDINVRYGREAKTFYKVQKTWGGACALVECKLDSGRTHQIRVHMQSIKHPVIGDPLYGAQKTAVGSVFKREGYQNPALDYILNFPRQALHAAHIEFIHPVSGQAMALDSDLPEDLLQLIAYLG